jgi:RimJ/RimL family protein N-acetyltransferase
VVRIFETERLIVRPWTEADTDRLFDMYSRMDVVRFLGSVPSPMDSPDQAQNAVERWRARSQADPTYGLWAVEVRDTGIVAGSVGLFPIPDAAGEVEVAWHLHPDCQGHGYATEAARGALERGFAAGLVQVRALTDPANTASADVCRRLGMELRGVSERYYGKPLQVWVSRPA